MKRRDPLCIINIDLYSIGEQPRARKGTWAVVKRAANAERKARVNDNRVLQRDRNS